MVRKLPTPKEKLFRWRVACASRVPVGAWLANVPAELQCTAQDVGGGSRNRGASEVKPHALRHACGFKLANQGSCYSVSRVLSFLC
jgi:hypothetical protein